MTPTAKKKSTSKKKPTAKQPPKKKVAPRKKAVAKKPVKKTKAAKDAEILEVLEEIYQEPEEEQKNKRTKKQKNKAPVSPSMKMYRRIAIGFIAVTLFLLATVIILSTIRATVTVYSSVTTMNTEFIADVVAETEMEGEIPGRVIDTTIDETREFVVDEEGASAVPTKAGGMVTIYNTSNRSQPLVATTRLMSPDGILFRIDKGVTVPAQGTVETMAHADEEGQGGEIEPTTFSIPGLNSTRQKEVHAESFEPMTGGVEYHKIVTEEDLQAARDQLNMDLLAVAQEDLRTEVPDTYTGETFFEEVIGEVVSVSAGDEADSYTISMSIHVVGVFYDQAPLLTIAEAKLYEGLEKGYQLFIVDREGMTVEVERYDLEHEIANVRVTLEGLTMVSPTNALLDKTNLVGLPAQDLKDMLIDAGVAVGVDVEFFPFWIRKVPKLRDHVEIKIEEPEMAQ